MTIPGMIVWYGRRPGRTVPSTAKQATAILERDTGPRGDDAGAEALVQALHQRHGHAIAVHGTQIDGPAGGLADRAPRSGRVAGRSPQARAGARRRLRRAPPAGHPRARAGRRRSARRAAPGRAAQQQRAPSRPRRPGSAAAAPRSHGRGSGRCRARPSARACLQVIELEPARRADRLGHHAAVEPVRAPLGDRGERRRELRQATTRAPRSGAGANSSGSRVAVCQARHSARRRRTPRAPARPRPRGIPRAPGVRSARRAPPSRRRHRGR